MGAVDGKRHVGQLAWRSSTGATTHFTSTELKAGRVFEADLKRLLTAVQRWEGCLREFQESASPVAQPATIHDGTGPVAHHLGQRFNHRLGAKGGIGYAANVYVDQFEAILAGLIQSAKKYADVEDDNTGTLSGQAPRNGTAP